MRTCGSWSINVNAKDAAKQGALAVTADAREALVALTEWVRDNGRITTHEYEATVLRHRRDWHVLRSRAIFRTGPSRARR